MSVHSTLPPSFVSIALDAPDGREFSVVGDAEPGEYERWLTASRPRSDVAWLLWRLLTTISQSATLIDVGANIGTIALALAPQSASVVAIEALPRNCLKLHLGNHLNGLRNLRVVQAAASNFDGVVGFGGDEAWGHVGAGDQQVVALRLDRIAEITRLADTSFDDRPVVLKIDVEGHELQVLEGAVDLIARRRPPILFESIEIEAYDDQQNSKRCKRLLESKDFRLFLQRGQTLSPLGAEQIQEGHVCDVLAIPAERLDLVAALDVRPLRIEERAAWVSEMAAFPCFGHRLHAANVIPALVRADTAYRNLLLPLLPRLIADDDPAIAAAARNAADAVAAEHAMFATTPT